MSGADPPFVKRLAYVFGVLGKAVTDLAFYSGWYQSGAGITVSARQNFRVDVCANLRTHRSGLRSEALVRGTSWIE